MTKRLSASTARLIALGIALALGGCVGTPAVVETPSYGATCYAGIYTCQLAVQAPPGSQCTCPGIGAPSFGAVR